MTTYCYVQEEIIINSYASGGQIRYVSVSEYIVPQKSTHKERSFYLFIIYLLFIYYLFIIYLLFI